MSSKVRHIIVGESIVSCHNDCYSGWIHCSFSPEIKAALNKGRSETRPSRAKPSVDGDAQHPPGKPPQPLLVEGDARPSRASDEDDASWDQSAALFDFVRLNDGPPSFPPEANLDTHRELAKEFR